MLLILRESLPKDGQQSKQSSYDANNDGVITRDELNEGHMSRIAWQGPAWGQRGELAPAPAPVPAPAAKDVATTDSKAAEVVDVQASLLKMSDERLANCLRVALAKHATLQQKESFSQGQLDESHKR